MGRRANLGGERFLAAFTGTILAATVDHRWLALPAIVTGFLFQHFIQGCRPTLPICAG